MIEALKSGDIEGVDTIVEGILTELTDQVAPILNDLAAYENEFSIKMLKRFTDKEDVVGTETGNRMDDVQLSTTLNTDPITINDAYNTYATMKAEQYQKMLDEFELDDEEDTITAIKEKTDGQFSYQLAILAGLSITAMANTIRAEVADNNNMLVDWVLDLELNNCPDCEDYADGGPYTADQVDGLIPLHANCGCTLVPVNE